MNTEVQNLIENLNHQEMKVRLDSLKSLMHKIEAGDLERPLRGKDVNNHIHTTYSFSPYSPAKAVWMAFSAGLSTAGIMDHDSIGGAMEFIEAGRIAGVATTVGVECRADFSKTFLNGKRFNNPDQNSIAYVALHGIPHTQVETFKEFFKPYTEHRNVRNAKMVEKLNGLLAFSGISLDFEKDVMSVSNFACGGSITERHILYALSQKLILKYGKGTSLLDFLKGQLALDINSKTEGYLRDPGNPHYVFDLLGLLKSGLVDSFYIPADAECPDVKDVIRLAKRTGAIMAYAYLGDVGDSVTGDKKPQKFEDSYIEQLFALLKELGFDAVTYMPSRNSMSQLDKVRQLCDQYGFFQISGEDINSSRQSFICEAQRNDRFQNLFDATWALIGHENAATADLDKGMFSSGTIRRYPSLHERIQIYKELGLSSNIQESNP